MNNGKIAKNETGEGSLMKRHLFCALIVLAALALLALSGCKYSDVLTQHLEDPSLGVLDESADPEYRSNPDAELVMDLAELSLDEADDENAQVESLPHYDPNAPDNGPTKRRLKSEETPHDEAAAEGSEQEGQPDREGNGEGDEGGQDETPTDDAGEEGQKDEGTGDDLASDEVENPADQPSDAGNGGTTVVVDPDDGTNEETAKGTVAAVGEYATIAHMLGGAGALAACDEEWLAARKSDGCFEGELELVQTAFKGDGTQAGSCDVDALVNTVQPSVVLWDGTTPNLTDADRAVLEAAGIVVQSVPSLGAQTTEDYTVTQAVQGVASVLAGASGLAYDPVDTAEKYVSFHDRVLKAAYDANGGYSYKVVDGQYDYLYQDTPLSGLDAKTTTRATAVFVDEVMASPVSSAIVSRSALLADNSTKRWANDGETLDFSDGVALSSATSTSSYMLIDYYLQLAGVVNNAYDTAKPESSGKRYVLIPGSSTIGKTDAYASRAGFSAFIYNSGDATVAANLHALGDADFPAVIAATDDIAQVFVKSAAKADGLYRMENPYRVIVVPTGIAGSWAQGHIDSYLMALWAYGVKGEENLSTAAEWVEGFYRDYLRCGDWGGAVADWDTSYEVESG